MDEELKYKKRNLIAYPMGTIGRDAIYQLFTNFALTFILFTKISFSVSDNKSRRAAVNISPAAPIPQSRYNTFMG